MEKELYGYLQYEGQLLEEMLRLSDIQQAALLKYHLLDLSEITAFQEQLLKNMRQTEEKRLSLLMNWLGISRREAFNLKMSSLEKKWSSEDIANKMDSLHKKMRKMMEQLNNINNTNRVLTNRARTNVKEMLHYITGGKDAVDVAV